jgi:hypothetical protein
VYIGTYVGAGKNARILSTLCFDKWLYA